MANFFYTSVSGKYKINSENAFKISVKSRELYFEIAKNENIDFDLTINTNTNMAVRPTADGQPGLYKSYTDSGVDELGIDDAGTGYTVDLICATVYDPGAGGTEPGVGSGLTVKVTSIGGGGGDVWFTRHWWWWWWW